MGGPHQNNDQRRESRLIASWVRQYSLVLEFLASLGVFGYVGHVVDERYGSTPWALLGGMLAGMGFGIYLMLRESKRLDR